MIEQTEGDERKFNKFSADLCIVHINITIFNILRIYLLISSAEQVELCKAN